MKKNFLQSIAILSSSNLLAQVINMITYFVLPKYFYSPEEFGVLGFFLPFYYIFFEVINLKMDQAVMLPKKDSEAKQLMTFSWFTAFVIGISVIPLAFFISTFIYPLDIHIVYFLGVSLCMGGILQPILVWLNRQKKYFKMGNIRVVQAIATFIFSILFFRVFDTKFNGLVLGFVSGQVAALFLGVIFIPKRGWSVADRTLIKKYKQFIQFGSISSLVSTLSRNLPAFAIKFFFSDAILGWYTVATKYLNAPIGIFSTSIGQVYFKEASVAKQPQLQNLTKSIIRNIFILIVLPVLIILFFGENIFAWFLGSEWAAAGKITEVLILWYFIAYVSGPLSVLLDIKMKLKWELNYNMLLLLARGLALASAFFITDFYIVIGLFAAIGVIFNSILLTYILKLSRQNVE